MQPDQNASDSMACVVAAGADIIPAITDIETSEQPRTVADTDRGAEIRSEIEVLAALLRAYEGNVVQEQTG